MKKVLCVMLSFVLLTGIGGIAAIAQPMSTELTRVRFSVFLMEDFYYHEEAIAANYELEALITGIPIVIYRDGVEYLRAYYMLDGDNFKVTEVTQTYKLDNGELYYHHWASWGIYLNLNNVTDLTARLYLPDGWMTWDWWEREATPYTEVFLVQDGYINYDYVSWGVRFGLGRVYYAYPTTSTVLVNGEVVAFQAYNINWNNFFKLRDIAYVLNGTSAQFSIEWVEDDWGGMIELTRGAPYIPVGGEMVNTSYGMATATRTSSFITVDGRWTDFTAFLIGGNNYFRLRDLGEALGFNVDWCEDSQTIFIVTE